MEIIAQTGIATFGLLAIFLVARKNKWGFVFGLISVPFWFITSIINQQWGIFLLNIAYTASWIYGIWQWFFGRPAHRKPAKHLWEIVAKRSF
ncbi:nicotinamide mononucleotide transporter family protein [Patescibacteria group bacterium]|nr:nicotinamide mononucleotide transporter family protein [Patescibacteria group bacterium]